MPATRSNERRGADHAADADRCVTYPDSDSAWVAGVRNAMADDTITKEQRAARVEELVKLEAVIQAASGMSDADRERSRRGRELARTASRCFKCDAELRAVWRVRASFTAWGGRWSSRIVPVCGECVDDDTRAVAEYRKCKTCGRRVYETLPAVWNMHAACSEQCRRRIQTDQRRREREADRAKLKCMECGTDFTASRSDAMFCSNACKQADYRYRVRVERAGT